MAKFAEETLNNWRMPPSATEEAKLEGAERAVSEALSKSVALSKLNFSIFGQGSYANDTNVRMDSDVDINVRLSTSIYTQLPPGKTDADFGYTNSSYTYGEFKQTVFEALENFFGKGNVVRNNKCITVKGNSNRVATDVVPTLKLVRHDEDGSRHEGVKFISDAGRAIINFPLQHIENGKLKNKETQKRFKRLTRIYRRVRYRMIEENIDVSDKITSFLLECLVWNVPNNVFNDYSTWSERLRESILYLYRNTKDDSTCKNWGEVSDLLYLFVGRKWTREDVNLYLAQMWKYLELK